jgi:hypothetical protein
MTLEEFRRLADTWGGDIARWPEPLRGEAATLAHDPAAAEILAKARRLDRLATGSAPAVTERRAAAAMAAVAMRLAAERQQETARQLLPAGLLRWLAPTAALAGAAAFGIALGMVYPALPPNAAAGLMLNALFDDSIAITTVLQ